MSKVIVNEISPNTKPGIGIGAPSVEPSALLNIQSTTQGIVLPRMTTVQRDAIVSPIAGLTIYNTDINRQEEYNGVTWQNTGGGSASVKNVIRVVKNIVLEDGDFSSIKAAMDSITDSSPTNPYAIIVGPGIFVENPIVFKPYVIVEGSGETTTIIEANDPYSHLITGIASSEIYKCKLINTFFSHAIHHEATPSDPIGVFYARNCLFENNYVNYHCASSIANTNSRINDCRVIDSDTSINTSLLVEASNGFVASLNVTNFLYRDLLTPYPVNFSHVKGVGSQLRLLSSTIRANGTGAAVLIEDGADVFVCGSTFQYWNNGIQVSNIGAAPKISISSTDITDSTTYDLLVNHPGTTGSFDGGADSTKVSINPSANIKLHFTTTNVTDPYGMVVLGDIGQGTIYNKLHNSSLLARASSTMGVISGGTLTHVSGLTVGVSGGTGFYLDSNDNLQQKTWDYFTLTINPGTSGVHDALYIYFDINGNIAQSSVQPDLAHSILLGRAVTNMSVVENVQDSPMSLHNYGNNNTLFLREAIGPIFVYGCNITEVGTRQLSSTAGRYWFGGTVLNPSGKNPIPLQLYWRNGSGGYNDLHGGIYTTVDNAYYDNGTGTLTPITSGYYVKHSLYLTGEGSNEVYDFLYGQAEYATLVEVEAAALPTPPSWWVDEWTPIASIIVQQGTANIIEIRDERPRLGFTSPGIQASAYHSNLLGLTIGNDHPQYLLREGTNPMTGNLDMGNNDIINIDSLNATNITITQPLIISSGGTGQVTSLAAFNALSPMTSAGDLIYGGLNGDATVLPGNISTTIKFLTQVGDGVDSATLSWQGLPAAGSLSYYFRDTISDIPTYYKQVNTPQILDGTVAASGISGTQLVSVFITEPNFPNLEFTPSGTYEVHFHAHKHSGTKTVVLYGEIWEVSASGSDIAKIVTTETSFPLSDIVTQYQLFVANPNTHVFSSTTSRLATKIYATAAGSGTDADIELHMGPTYDSHTTLPSNTVDATNFVPYNGSVYDVNLGTHSLTASEVNGIQINPYNIINVLKNPGSGEFSSIKSAINSITTAASGNPFIVRVGPGDFNEDPFTIPPYVKLEGSGKDITRLIANNSNTTFITLSNIAHIKHLSIAGATGPSGIAIKFTPLAKSEPTVLDHIDFENNTILLQSIEPSYDSSLILDNIRVSSDISFITGFKLQATLHTLSFLITNSKIYNNSTDSSCIMFDLHGPLLDAKIFTTNTDYNLHTTGTHYLINNGATVQGSSLELDYGNIGIHIPNTGVAPVVSFFSTHFFNNNTWELLSEHPGASGLIFRPNEHTKVYINPASTVFLPNEDLNIITVRKRGGNFTSIKAAVDSITDASSGNIYLISISPGIFIEDTITLKPYVIIEGSGETATHIVVNAPNKNVIEGSCLSSISYVTLSGSTDSGMAAIYYSNNNPNGDAFTVRSISFDNTDILVKLVGGTQDALLDVSDIEYRDSIFDKAYVVENPIGTHRTILDVNSVRNSIENPFTVVADVSGLNSYFYFTNIVYSSSVGGKFITCYNGASLVLSSVSGIGFDIGLESQNIGVGPNIIANATYLNSNTYDVSVNHPGTTGSFVGAADSAKVSIDTSSTMILAYDDPLGITKGTVTLGDIRQGTRHDRLLNISKLISLSATLGTISGGQVTIAGGLQVTAASGTGFLNDPTFNYVKEVTWNATTLTLPSSSSNYIYVDSNGVVNASASSTSTTTTIPLARVITDGSVTFIENTPINILHRSNIEEDVMRRAFGPIYINGSLVTENDTRKLNVSNGSYYFGTVNVQPSGGSPISFITFSRGTSGSFIDTFGVTTVDNVYYDNGTGTLTPITSGYYVKHSLYLTGEGSNEEYFLVYGQAEYQTLVEAETATLATPPSFFTDAVARIASIIVRASTTNIVEIRDERPRLSFQASALSIPTYHNQLLGLIAGNDHPQYLLTNGSNSMSGNLNMATNNIVNIGTMNGVTIETHAGRHLPNGADSLITAAPSVNLTANTSNSVGIANSLARSDHSHAITTGGALSTSTTNTAGTSAALARADHTHNTVLTNNQVSSNTLTTTTSAAFTTISNMTITPISGTYLVLFSCDTNNSNSGNDINFSIFVGGIQDNSSNRIYTTPANVHAGIATQTIVTVNGSQAVDARWNVSGGTGNITNRTLTLVRIG